MNVPSGKISGPAPGVECGATAPASAEPATNTAGSTTSSGIGGSATEAGLRVQLAACYRIFAMLGWTELIYNHITARVPGPERDAYAHHLAGAAFGCTIQGQMASAEVERLARAVLDMGADQLSLADTVGYAASAAVPRRRARVATSPPKISSTCSKALASRRDRTSKPCSGCVPGWQEGFMIPALKPYPFTAKRYPARLPELRDAAEAKRHPVVIVGGGPVGFTAALGLASHGVPSVLVEADDSVCFGSRAICISRRSLEIMQRAGALEGFLKAGLPWTGGRSFYRDVEVLNFTMPQDENQKLPPMVNLAQYHIEQFMLDAAERHGDLIDIRWNTRVTAIESREDGALLSLSAPDGEYKLEADWVVASDGGRSFLREALGLQLQGTSYEGRYVIVDIELESDRPTERLAYFDPSCNRGSTVLVHKQPDNVWRIDYQLRDGEDPEEAIKPENVLPRVQSLLDMMGERGNWSPIWITVYKANALTLDRYRHGRVLFAGDAAHLVPIFGVRGANSGIDDADNLAWKLAFVVKGLASESLLDSYSEERVAAARENLSFGMKSTEFMAPPSFAFDLMRKAVLGLAIKHPGVRSLINPRQTSAISYDNSPLNQATERSAEFDAGPAPGTVLSECPLTITENGAASEGHLTDLVGPRFTALWFTDEGEVPDELEELTHDLESRAIPFRLVTITRHLVQDRTKAGAWDHTGRLFPMYGAKAGTLYLVRPDGHVLGRWRSFEPREVAAAIEQVLGTGPANAGAANAGASHAGAGHAVAASAGAVSAGAGDAGAAGNAGVSGERS